jgi:DNA (cytosine-5)-methyltransferase 1
MASKRKTRSSSTSGNTVTVTADSNSGDTQKKSRTTNVDTASSAVETKEATEIVPMKVEGNDEEDEVSNSRFLGDPVPDEEAKLRWPKRYQEEVILTICRKLNTMYENSM